MYLNSIEAKNVIEKVLDEVYDMVVGTMGPNGKLAIYQHGSVPKTTKDGVTVAKNIAFDTPGEEWVNRVLTQPAIKTETECGDGTTTTIFLTKHLFDVLREHSTFIEQKQVERLVNYMIDTLTRLSVKPDGTKAEVLYQLALTSSNNDDEIASTIMEAYRSAKGYPVIELKAGRESKDVVRTTDGLPLKMYFSNPIFSAHKTGENTKFENVLCVVVDSLLNVTEDVPAQEYASQLVKLKQSRPGNDILLICRSMDDNIIHLLNNINAQPNLGHNKLIGINTGQGGTHGTNVMGDITAVLNTSMVTDVRNINDTEFGIYSGVIEINDQRSILPSISDETRGYIQRRIGEIQSYLDEQPVSDKYNVRVRYNEKRIIDLSGELITIFVGGETNSDVEERKDRFDDVNKAVRSALENGILPGCGWALRTVGERMWDKFHEDESIDENILHEMVDLCLRQWTHLMSGVDEIDELAIQEHISKMEFEEIPHQYVNIATGQRASNPTELGIYDTAYAAITALKGGFKTAKILANTQSILLGTKSGSVQF